LHAWTIVVVIAATLHASHNRRAAAQRDRSIRRALDDVLIGQVIVRWFSPFVQWAVFGMGIVGRTVPVTR